MNILKLYLQEGFSPEEIENIKNIKIQTSNLDTVEKAEKKFQEEVIPIMRKEIYGKAKKLLIVPLVVSIISMGVLVYKTKLQKLGTHCKLIKDTTKKKKCFINARIKSQQYQLKMLASKATLYCKRTDNSSECLRKIRNEIGQKIRNQLRAIPEFIYYLDDSLDYIDRIDNLLKE